MMGTRWARFARGWVAAGFSTFVAALSHTLGGGAAPGTLAVVVSLAFAGIICMGLAGRTLSLWRVVASVVVSQLILHGLFSLGASGGALVTSSETLHGAHQHATVGVVHALAGAGAGTSGVPGMAHLASHAAAMWIAHGIAALVTIVALRHGEAAFWGLFSSARLAVRYLFVALGVAITPAPRRRTVPPVSTRAPRRRVLVLSVMRHRGPPVTACAVAVA